MKIQRPPELTIIAGPNGAGKTTFARAFLPSVGLYEFLNADSIAAGLSPLKPELKALAAGRLLLQRWQDLAKNGKTFAVESTLSGKTYVRQLELCRRQGYLIRICYLSLPDVEKSIARVGNRVAMGGHDIPEVDLRRRFQVGLHNFLELYLPLADEALLYDSSDVPATLVATWKSGVRTVKSPSDYERITKIAASGD